MLSPARYAGAFTQQELELIEMLGCTQAEYLQFLSDVRSYSRLRPGEPVAFLPAIAGIGWFGMLAINLAVGVGLTAVAMLMAPKAPKPAGQPNQPRNVEGQSIVDNAGFTPKTGFDGIQNVVELGSTIPVVFAKREIIDDVVYGGVRINTNLLWSEAMSLQGGLMLRALLMIGEAPMPPIDTQQIAIGNNLLNSYVFEKQARNDYGRVTYYYSGDGGRIVESDYVGGRNPGNDEGNSTRYGAADVYSVRKIEDKDWTQDFCQAYRPSTQTTFGLFAPIGNGLTYLVNPRVNAGSVATFVPYNKGQDLYVVCKADPSERARRQKQEARFNSRANVYGSDGSIRQVDEGDTVTYTMSSASDVNTVFTYGSRNQEDGKEYCNDVASAVANRSRQYDDRLVLGELYKLGSAYLVLTSRTEAPYGSTADGTSSTASVTAKFKVVSPGAFMTTSASSKGSTRNPTRNGTNCSHLFRVARASVVTERPCQIVEIGLRSTVGLRFSGLMNFRDSRTYREADGKACDFYDGDDSGGFTGQRYTSGTYTGPETRYSFFRIYYRKAGTLENYRTLSRLYGIRSNTQAAVYNSIRIQFPSEERWEIMLDPVSGWEIRTGLAKGDLEVLDWRMRPRRIYDTECNLRYNGLQVSRSATTFGLQQGISREKRIGDSFPPIDSGNYIDAWGKLAELFCYEEVSASVDSPEHEIAYINQVTENDSVPTYGNLALLGMNIRSSTELSQMQQVSVYITLGLGTTHLFPEILVQVLTNDRWGVGSILSGTQVDAASMDAAAAWTRKRLYFFDGAISERLNVISWATEISRRFLLDFIYQNGVYSLKPMLNFDGPEEITGIFDAGNIVENSFTLTYADPNDRQPPRISVKWRQEAAGTGDAFQRGLFAEVREVSIQEASTPDNAPLEQVDVSAFCTSERHAIDIGKFECRFRRLSTHTISFKVMPSQASLQLATCFKLALSTVASAGPMSGHFDEGGVMTMWGDPLPDGNYPILLWDGADRRDLAEETLTVANGQPTTPHRASVFAVLTPSQTVVETYKVQALSFDEQGLIDVRAMHWPTDAGGVSLIGKDWDAGWRIDK